MTACVDWSPLAATDPVPGDPGAVRRMAGAMAGTAAAAREAAGAVRQGGPPSWRGAAAEAFGALVADLPPLLERVAARYDGAAQALTAYADALGAARTQAAEALALAREPALDLVGARRLLAQAVGARDQAAGAATARLEVVAHDALRDQRSLGRMLGGLTHALAEFTVHKAHLPEVSAFLAGAAFLTAGAFPPAAGVIEVCALVTGGVALAAQAELARTGDGSWGEAGATAAGFAMFGVARAYGATTRAAQDVRKAEQAVLDAGADAQRVADATAALAAARGYLPRHPLVPRREHLVQVRPSRILHDAREDWSLRHTPRPPRLHRARETARDVMGHFGYAVAVNTAVRVGVEADSKRRTVAGAVPE